MAEAMEKELCYYCKLPFTIDQLLNHQLKCNTSQDYDCYSCGKKIKLTDTWEHECEIYHEEHVERNQTKLCAFCGNQIQKNYYDQHVIDYINDKFMSDNLIIELDQMDLRLQSNESYHTQPSYTVDGYFYRFKIFGYSNQEDKMGIYFQLIQSPKDHSLKWPFMKTVTCTVKNECIENTKIIANYSEPLKECFEKPAQAYNRAIGTDSFATHDLFDF
nr:uncharacterized protein LOC124815119 [Hydra vulgaris]